MCRVLILLLAALLSACNLSQSSPTPLPTPNAPVVQFRFPLNNSTVLEGTELIIELLASDPGAGVARVELLVDDMPHQEGAPQVGAAVPTFTVQMNWLAQGIGQHALTAIAYRADGAASAPQTIIIEVLPRESS